MKIRNRTNEVLNRPDNGQYRIQPGAEIVVPDDQGKYLIEFEGYYWEQADVKPAGKGGK